MPLPKNRSNSVRKIYKRTPKGSTIHYRRRIKGGRHSCALCGGALQAVSSRRELPASARSPNRKFGGSLCTSCSSRVIALASRVKEGMSLDEVDVGMLPYVKRLSSA
jgi:large subunit ribosomal protein L34e